MIDFSLVKELVIPEGVVSKVTLPDGTAVWQKESAMIYKPAVDLSFFKDESIGKLVCTVEASGVPKDQITKFGLIYIKKSLLGTKVLTANTAKRNMMTFSKWDDTENGVSCTWNETVTTASTNSSTAYVFRGYLVYTDTDGSSKEAYSDAVTTSYDAFV